MSSKVKHLPIIHVINSSDVLASDIPKVEENLCTYSAIHTIPSTSQYIIFAVIEPPTSIMIASRHARALEMSVRALASSLKQSMSTVRSSSSSTTSIKRPRPIFVAATKQVSSVSKSKEWIFRMDPVF